MNCTFIAQECEWFPSDHQQYYGQACVLVTDLCSRELRRGPRGPSSEGTTTAGPSEKSMDVSFTYASIQLGEVSVSAGTQVSGFNISKWEGLVFLSSDEPMPTTPEACVGGINAYPLVKSARARACRNGVAYMLLSEGYMSLRVSSVTCRSCSWTVG